MTVYCGVDFHARQQTVCYCDTADGELHLSELEHEGDNVRGFYSRFTGKVKRWDRSQWLQYMVRRTTGGPGPPGAHWGCFRDQAISEAQTEE
jgi:hypothetical protein